MPDYSWLFDWYNGMSPREFKQRVRAGMPRVKAPGEVFLRPPLVLVKQEQFVSSTKKATPCTRLVDKLSLLTAWCVSMFRS